MTNAPAAPARDAAQTAPRARSASQAAPSRPDARRAAARPAAAGRDPGMIERLSRRPWYLNARDAVIAIGFLLIVAGSVASIAQYLEGHDSAEAPAAPAVTDQGDASTAAESGVLSGDTTAVVSEQPGNASTAVATSVAGSQPPAPAAPGTYVVVKGDVLYAIAVRFGTTPQVLADLNDLSDPNRIEVGQVLLLPEGSTDS